jgi:hypothetical protein
MTLQQPATEIMDAMEWAGTYPRVFVESGAFHGRTAKCVQDMFKRVITIELSRELYRKASENLTGGKVELMLGDSAIIIPALAAEIREGVCWFLDAHWNDRMWEDNEFVAAEAPMPLWCELEAIRNRVGKYHDLVVVDDVHAFGRNTDGPRGFEGSTWQNVNADAILRASGGVKTQILRDILVVEMPPARRFTDDGE